MDLVDTNRDVETIDINTPNLTYASMIWKLTSSIPEKVVVDFVPSPVPIKLAVGGDDLITEHTVHKCDSVWPQPTQ